MELISIRSANISRCFMLFVFLILLQLYTLNVQADNNQEITGTLVAIKKELILSSKLSQNQEAIIIKSKEKIYHLKKNEIHISKELSTLKDQLSNLTIALQKISSRPIFAYFLTDASLLSVARSINLIKFLKGELEQKGSDLNTKLTTLATLQKKLSVEDQRYRIASIKLAQENQKLSALVNKEKFILGQNQLENSTTKNSSVSDKNLPLNLKELLANLQYNRIEKEQAIVTLKKLSENISLPSNLVKNSLDGLFSLENKSNTEYLTEKHQGLTSLRSFHKNKLNIRLPVAGEIVELFGKPDLIGLTAKGITIATRGGANVVAAFDGKVLYAGPFRKYGEILIITHGEGFSSLLIGMSSIHVKTGQDLLGGEPVGVMTKSSSTGTKLNQRLYIELRKHGKPIDPMAWLSLNRNAT